MGDEDDPITRLTDPPHGCKQTLDPIAWQIDGGLVQHDDSLLMLANSLQGADDRDHGAIHGRQRQHQRVGRDVGGAELLE